MCLLIPLKKEHRRNGTLAEDICKDYMSVAEETIDVYKVLERSGDDLVSPYLRNIYNVGETYREKFSYAEHITSHIGYNRVHDHLGIHRGLHAYASVEAAVKDVMYEHNEVICRFTIPKGSFVFKEQEEVCSNTMKFEEVLAYANS